MNHKEKKIVSIAIAFVLIFWIAPIANAMKIMEGILSVVIIMGLETYAKSELTEFGFLNGGEN